MAAELAHDISQQAYATEHALVAGADCPLVHSSRAVQPTRPSGQRGASSVRHRAGIPCADAVESEVGRADAVVRRVAAADVEAIRSVRRILDTEVEPGDLRRQIDCLDVVVFVARL